MEGLFRRNGTWWARLVVPQRLRADAGRREFVKSTGSHDRAVGKLVASVLLANWRRQLYELERGRVDDQKILTLIEGHPELGGSGFIALRQAAQLSGLDVGDLLREVESGGLSLGCRVPRDSGSGYVMNTDDLDYGGPEEGYSVPYQPPAGSYGVDLRGEVLRLFDGGRDVAKLILAGLDRVELVLLERDWGERNEVFVPDAVLHIAPVELEVRAAEVEALRRKRAASVPVERVERARSMLMAKAATTAEGPAASKWAQKRFSEALAVYCEDADGLPGKIASEHEIRHRRGQISAFAELMGDLQLCEISADVLRTYRDGPLKTIPGSANKLPKQLRRSTLKETIEALRLDGRDWPLLSDEMRRERMAHIGAFFDWLERKGHLAPNPAASLRGETGMSKAERNERRRANDDDENGRRPFSENELALIFGQQHFKTGHGRHEDWAAGEWYPFQYWLPLLGLYGGVRIKEGSQLYLDDVRQIDGVWVLDINETTPDKRLKSEQSKRLIPLHPELKRLGFLEYCESLRAKGFKRVFPELTCAKTDASYGKEPGRRMSAMLESLGMPRDGKLVFHCLRHNCNNALLRTPEDVTAGGAYLRSHAAKLILGHAIDGGANEQHYTEIKIHEKAAVVSSVNIALPPIAPFDIKFGLNCVRVALGRKQGERRGKEDMGILGLNTPKVSVLTANEAKDLATKKK